MTVVIGRPHFVHARVTTRPGRGRPPESDEANGAEHEPTSPRTPTGPLRLTRHPLGRSTPLALPPAAAPAGSGSASAPSDFVLHANTDIGCGHAVGFCSLVNEPSVAVHGSNVFETWNWSAGRSVDGGANFAYMDPYSVFPDAYGGFCCDQLAYYEPTRDLYVWALQYVQDDSGNAIRLAFAHGDADFAAGRWYYWDLKPGDVGSSGFWYDQPKVSSSSNYLYVEVSRYATSDNSFGGSVLLRLPLDTIAAHGTLTQDAYATRAFSPGPVQGATRTMYFGAHVNTSTLRVYSWPESVGPTGVRYTDVGHSRYPKNLPYSCPRLGGTFNSDWCQRVSGTGGFAHDDRINSGWVQNGVIGFSWDAAQGTVAGGVVPRFRYPYVHVVRIREADKALFDEPIAWSNSYAVQWSSLAANANGDLGGLVEYGGGASYENCGALIHDGFTSPNAFWEIHNVASSTVDTAQRKSGDYLTVRQNGNTWSGACYTISGSGDNGDAHPHYVNFGRAGVPPPTPPLPFVPPTLVTASVGPGRAIKVTRSGRKVSSVTHGSFKIVVQDRSRQDDFHLTCKGVNKTTTIKGKSTATWNVTLVQGTCSYKSDAHKQLKGSFRVL